MGEEIDTVLTPEDAAAMPLAYGRPAFGSKNWGRHERWRRVLAGVALGGLFFALVKAYVHRESGLDLPPWIDGLAPVGAGALIGWMLRPRVPPAVEPGDPRIGRRWLAAGPDGFRIRAPDFTVEIAWRAVADFRAQNGWLFLTTTWGEIYSLPLRMFDGAGEPLRLADLEAAWRAARVGGV